MKDFKPILIRVIESEGSHDKNIHHLDDNTNPLIWVKNLVIISKIQRVQLDKWIKKKHFDHYYTLVVLFLFVFLGYSLGYKEEYKEVHNMLINVTCHRELKQKITL